jgi:hypothetical protein
MDPTGVTKEVGETTRGFFNVMKENPLSLALVVVVFALAAMQYYTNKETLEQRTRMSDLIINWQKEQQVILGGCVSAEVTKGMMDNMQKITETMLTYNNAEIKRMQEAIDKERDRSFNLRERREQDLRQQIPTPDAPPPQRQNLRRSPVFKDIDTPDPDALPLEPLKFPLHFEQLLQPPQPLPSLQPLDLQPPHELFKMPP